MIPAGNLYLCTGIKRQETVNVWAEIKDCYIFKNVFTGQLADGTESWLFWCQHPRFDTVCGHWVKGPQVSRISGILFCFFFKILFYLFMLKSVFILREPISRVGCPTNWATQAPLIYYFSVTSTSHWGGANSQPRDHESHAPPAEPGRRPSVHHFSQPAWGSPAITKHQVSQKTTDWLK